MLHIHARKLNKSVFSFIFNLFIIIGMLLSPVSAVFAQDGSTPVPGETPTDPGTLTPEPTAVPTEIVRSGELPNFNFEAPEGWEAAVVLSSQAGTHINDTLTNSEDQYLDLAVLNSGVDTSTPFTTCLKIDGEQVQCWDAAGLAAGTSFTVEDWLYSANRGAGSHRFEVTADVNNTVAESDETDNTWAFDFTWLPSEIAGQSVGSPLINDVRTVPELDELRAQSSTGSSAPGRYDMSAYMTGSVAVGVILPESAGSGENWTTTERDQVYAEIQAGLNKWVDWSDNSTVDTNKDSVLANVSFTYDWRYAVPVPTEPIQGSSYDDTQWIAQAYNNMGFTNSGGWVEQNFDYLESLRDTKGTDWAMVVFVVDSSADSDGMFTDGYFGYTYGFLTVMTYDNDGYGIEDMDRVMQHETSHVFGSADTYSAPGYGGCMNNTDLAGYLGIQNSNCEYVLNTGIESTSIVNTSADLNVLMTNSNPDRNHWTNQYQIGWRDSDGDRLADVVDTLPKFSMSALQPDLTVNGAVYDEPYNSSTYWPDVTLNTITSARYYVDSGPWQALSASDGAYNSDREVVTFDLGSLANGEHAFYVEATNSRGNTNTTVTNFTLPLVPPANDRLTSAIPMALNTTYPQLTGWATVTSEEPVNVCNAGDTGSVWYRFTAPSSGVYKLSAYDSDYSPNLSVLRQVSSSSRTPVVCGTTDTDYSYKSELAFNATSGYTYLFEVSAVGGGSLNLNLQKLSCPTGRLCGAVVGGDGQVVRNPYMRILDSSGNQKGSGNGDYNGFISGYLYYGGSGSFKVFTSGSGNFIVNNSVSVPGTFAPSAVGLPRSQVIMKDTSGNPLAIERLTVVSAAENSIGDYLYDDETSVIYTPVGIYNFNAVNDTESLEVYKPGFNIVSSSNPGTITLDASTLPQDTFTFDLDGITDSFAYIYTPDYYANYLYLTGDRTITFAAPADTVIPWIDFTSNKYDDISELSWHYSTSLDNYGYIQGGVDHAYQVGGALSLSPYASNAPIRLDEGYGGVYPGVADAYGNQINQIYYEGYSDSGAATLDAQSRSELIERLTTSKTEDGQTLHRPLVDPDLLTAQGWVWENVMPIVSLTDGVGSPVSTYESWSLGNPVQFDLYPSSNTGTWNFNESVDLGPLGGVKAAGTSFEVYKIAEYPLTNDVVASATVLTPPTSISQNTMGSTLTSTDPSMVGCLSWYYYDRPAGIASVWYKYLPAQDGVLSLDTIGSDYDTALAVYLGTPSVSNRKVCNDDQHDPVWDMDAKVSLDVKAGSTYYIEIVDTGFTDGKGEMGALSIEPQSLGTQSFDDVEIQSFGGSLKLNASLQPCYSLTTTASPSSGGSITRTPAANCLGTKYVEGTPITLEANPATNFGFWKWSDGVTINPYGFNIGANTTLQSLFIAVSGTPSLSSPADKALAYHDSTWLRWAPTLPVSDHYIVSVAKNAAFTEDQQTRETTDTFLQPDWLEPNTTYYWTVRGVNLLGQLGPWSAVRSFRAAIEAPELSDPSEGSALPTNRPVFNWDLVDGATGYSIQIAKDILFKVLVTSGSPVGNSYVPTVNLPAAITLYWRVQTKAVNGPSVWSAYRSFTVPVAPPIPTLVAPANSALTTDRLPLLDWSDVLFASYELEVSRDINFTDLQFTAIPPASKYQVVSGELDFNQTYYWHVRSFDVAGNYSGWSLTRSLRTAVRPPNQTAPGNTVQELRPTFDWAAVDSATGYSLQIGRDELFKSSVGTYSTTALVTEYTPTANLPADTTLWWRVQTKAVNGPSAWSDPSPVNMPNPPSTPSLLLPANGALVQASLDPVLSWSKSTVPSGAFLFARHQLWISKTSDFKTLARNIDDVDLPLLSEPIAALEPNTTYYWKVRAYNTNSDFSAWSTVRTFRTAVAAPELQAMPDPLYTNRPTFNWNSVTGATGYSIQIAKDAAFKVLVTSGSLADISYVPTMNLPANIPLYWRVQAKAVNGPSRWSSEMNVPVSFMVPVAPPIPTLVAPASSTLITNLQPLLDWSDVVASPPLANYEVVVSRNIIFTDQQLIETTLPTVSNYPVNSLQLDSNRTYYWHVRTVDTVGNYSGWSLTRSFRTAVQPPENLSPESGETPTDLRPSFDWDEVEGATGYTLQISKNVGFSSLAGTFATSAAMSEYTPTANLPANVTLWWRVQAKAVNGPSAWSEVKTISMPNPPSVPVITAPKNNVVVATKQPKLDWGNSTLPVGETFENYRVQLADNSGFVSPIYNNDIYGTPANSEFAIPNPLLNNTTYYWRVRACNDHNHCSAWMTTAQFKVSIIDTLKVNIGTLPDRLDPQKASYVNEITHLKMIYEGLTKLDENLETIPAAASAWSYNGDATEIIFTLRSNLKYTDGSLLNAKRFEYAILRAIDPKTEGEYAGILDAIEGAAEWRSLDLATNPPSQYAYYKSLVKVKAVDPLGKPCTSYTQTNCLTLKIGFDTPTPYFHTIASLWVTYPAKEEKITAGGVNWWASAANHVGNGPFKMTTYNVSEKSTFIPNTYYWGGQSKYNMEYRYIVDGAVSLQAYKDGLLDIIPIPADLRTEIEADPDISTDAQFYSGSCTFSLMFHQNKAPFDNQKVREAFAYAFDRDAWVADEDILNRMGSSTLTWIPEGFPGYDAAETRWGYNPTAAVEALEDSGYTVGTLPLITATFSDTPRNNLRWQWIHDQMLDVLGVDIALNPVPSTEYTTLVNNPDTAPQMYIKGWCADFPDPQNWLSTYWKTGAFGASIGYSNAALDAKLELADSTIDPDVRMTLYAEAQTMLMDDAPIANLWNNINSYLVNPRVQNFNLTPMDNAWAGDMVPLSIYLE